MKRKIRGNTASRQYTDRYTLSSSKWQNDYNVLYRSASVDDDEFGSLEVFNGFAGQVSIIAPYDDADYFWAIFENGSVKLIQGTKVKDKMYYMTPDDWDMTNSEWCQEVVNMIVDALDEKNRNIKSEMIHMSTDIDTADSVNSSTTIEESSEAYSADELRQQIKYELHKIMKNQLGFEDDEIESYSRVDAYFVDNQLVIEVGCEVEYEALEQMCNQLNPIIQECDPDAYFEPEQPGIISAYLSIENCEDAIESSTKVIRSSAETWIDNYFNRVDTVFICRNAGYEPEDLISVDDIDEYDGDHVAWLVPKPEYTDVLDDFGIIELVDEDGELFISQTSHDEVYDITSQIRHAISSIESSTKVVGGLYDIPERPLDPPEDDDYEEETDNTTVYIDFDTTITVDKDGDYDYDEGYSFADCPDNEQGSWYSATYNVYLGDGADMVEYIDDLIITQVPVEPGKYHIKGEAQLYFEVDNIQVSRDYFWDERHGGDYDEEAYTDNAEVYFNKAGSSLEKFRIEKI